MMPLLDDDRRRQHKFRNDLHSVLLVAGLGLVTTFSVWLLWSWLGVLVTLVWFAALFFSRRACRPSSSCACIAPG